MVGIVIVSHSAQLAEGVAELARGMGGPDVAVAAAGGLALPGRPLGTDAVLVAEAIERVYSDDGVVVLIDLGSALLSAEMAVEQLIPERQARVVICGAPLVEGALAAAVQARLGADLEQVLAEARESLAPKAAQVQPGSLPAPVAEPQTTESPRELRLIIRNRLGLHARPAARLTQAAGRFAQTEVRVSNLTTGGPAANAKSINAVATLGARQGHEILVAASGPEAQAALAAIQQLADDYFGDAGDALPVPVSLKDSAQPPALAAGFALAQAAAATLQGRPGSPGIALGPARLLRSAAVEVPSHLVVDTQAEWQRLMVALEITRGQIEATRRSVAQRGDAHSAGIFEAHLLFLEDEALREPAHRSIFQGRLNAAAAWQGASEQVAAAYRALDDEYLRARAADVEGVGRQVLQNLLDSPVAAPAMLQPGILIAPDLTPAQTVQLDPAIVLAVCTAFGGPTSHSAILARALGIPAVVGCGETVLAIAEGTPMMVDGEAGLAWLNPDDTRQADYQRRCVAHQAAQRTAGAARFGRATTLDGRRVEVAANIGSAADARLAAEAGAEAVGLFRTEFLFLDRQTAPDEFEQEAAYRAAAVALGDRPLVIRTLDVGGDKPLPYLDLGNEANPFLGWRAIRICLAQPELFKTQLRAIVRVAADHPIRVMFPMIATLQEWRAARALLEEARLEVQQQGQAVPDGLETGIMIEIPAAALLAEHFANEVDFFSIGTNDLTQYTLAAERGNHRVAGLADPLHPSVLRLIAQVVEAAHARGKWVGVCGEVAGDPAAVPLLVGLGVDELSLNAPAIPRVKEIIRHLNQAALGPIAQFALAQDSAEAVRQLLAPGATEPGLL